LIFLNESSQAKKLLKLIQAFEWNLFTFVIKVTDKIFLIDDVLILLLFCFDFMFSKFVHWFNQQNVQSLIRSNLFSSSKSVTTTKLSVTWFFALGTDFTLLVWHLLESVSLFDNLFFPLFIILKFFDRKRLAMTTFTVLEGFRLNSEEVQ